MCYSEIQWSDWALVVTGACAVIYAAKTLRAIERQAKANEAQLTEIRSAGQQTERLIEQAKEQSDTAKQSLDLSRDATIKQLRAYVLVDSALVRFQRPDFLPEAEVVIRNFGRTPAIDVESWIAMYVGSYPLGVVFPTAAPTGTPIAKEPLAQGRRSTHFVRSRQIIPDEIRAKLGTPEATVYVYGGITYKDIFGAQWQTHYRMFCGGNKGGLRPVKKAEGAIEGYVMQSDETGNDAT
jgi:hypothetical protein